MNWGRAVHPSFLLIMPGTSYIEEVSSVDGNEVLYDLNGFSNLSGKTEESVRSFGGTRFMEIFSGIFRSIPAFVSGGQAKYSGGNSFLTNLTCCTPIETNLSLKDIFFRSKALYKLWQRSPVHRFLSRNIRSDTAGENKFLSDERNHRRHSARCGPDVDGRPEGNCRTCHHCRFDPQRPEHGSRTSRGTPLPIYRRVAD